MAANFPKEDRSIRKRKVNQARIVSASAYLMLTLSAPNSVLSTLHSLCYYLILRAVKQMNLSKWPMVTQLVCRKSRI